MPLSELLLFLFISALLWCKVQQKQYRAQGAFPLEKSIQCPIDWTT